MRIVVVEDEIRIREGLCRLIGKISPEYEVVGQAENGREGFDAVLATNPDLIITDVKMPVMDGIDMLKLLEEGKKHKKAIILSAYSEFAYAQQAIILGVSEYLIKPITVDALTKSLKRIEEQFEQEKKMNPMTLGSLENILGGVIFGGLTADRYLLSYLQEKYRIYDDTIFAQVYFRLHKNNSDQKEILKDRIISMIDKINNLESHMVIPQNEQDILIVIYGFDAEQKLVDVLSKAIGLFNKGNIGVSVSVGWTQGIESLKAKYQEISQSMEWGIVLGDDVVIDSEKLRSFYAVPYTYPIKIENDMKTSICSNELRKIYRQKEIFIDYFKNKHYAPKGIKESYIRFVWAIINISKEIDMIDYGGINVQKILDNINNAVSYSELERELNALIGMIKAPENNIQDTISLTVNRAKRLIYEFYQSGISLEEIADKLGITPEYLGTLFREKTGLNFTAYMRNYRIGKAKELLIGTQMKLYEIALNVGYSDPKYFSRVFKECTGMLPAEYRKINK